MNHDASDSIARMNISEHFEKRQKMVIRDSVRVSKSLSWILRHGAVKEKIALDAEGYAELRYSW